MSRRSPLVAAALIGAVLASATTARSDANAPRGRGPDPSPVGVRYLRALGKHAGATLAPATGLVGALVALPKGKRAEELGLDAVAPGIGRLRASPARVEAFGLAHPELRIELSPPLHPLLDRVGQWIGSVSARNERGADGSGVMIGIADTGLDVTHPEVRDANGKSRVAWMLDLSLQPLGVFSELEEKFGLRDDTGKVIAGAVFSKGMIDDLLNDLDKGLCDEKTKKCAPSDEIGHGTHVAGIAAARGEGGKFPGVAPAADLVFVRVTRGRGDGIENDDLLRGVQFMFDRQEAEARPLVANISLGSEFGPHDGTFLFEQVIASHVGPDRPGRAIVAAAGNSGSIVESPIHQSVHVSRGARMRVPVLTAGSSSGSVQIWVTLRPGADLKLGLEGPDAEWIEPVERGRQNGKNTDDYNAGVIFGPELEGSPVPPGSNGGVVVWTGKWPGGTYNVTLEGVGMAELYLQGLGDASFGGPGEATFAHGVREGTITQPATHPSIIGVGCTINRAKWTSIAGAEGTLKSPLLDTSGGLALTRPSRTTPGVFVVDSRQVGEGEVCWFSSAGPTAVGAPKPEISAPGALVVSAMSRNAKPGVSGSVFTNPGCPPANGKPDARCFQIDDTHGVSIGTSMSSPVVAGVIAMLLQKDPTLTQDKILALLQGGAHRFRTDAPYQDQAGPGEVDAMGALDALDQMKNPTLQLPASPQSWLTLSADYVAADGSTPMTAILELRTGDGQHRADFFDGARLQPVLKVDGVPVSPAPQLLRRGPGVWFFTWTPPRGLGGSRATVGATFDGAPIVAQRTVPIATDRWNAGYPSYATGSACSMHVPSGARAGLSLFSILGLLGALGLARRVTRSRA
jgi:subtilisin family serine protease